MSDRFALLSDREREVLLLLAEGHAPKDIARRLDRSERTIYLHLSNGARKLGVARPREAAMMLARENSLGPYAIPPSQSLQVAPTPPFLIDLLVPELSGRPFNDLNVPRRLVVIASRTALLAFTLFAIAALVRDIGIIVGHRG